MKIRPFRDEDAVAAAEVVRPLERAFTVTPQGLRHQERSMPERAHRQSWVALDDGDVVGFATVWFRWAAGPTAHPRIWVGVRPDRRRRGIGSALYELAEAHAVAHGARWLNTELDEDDDGIAFANARRFELSTTPSEVELIVVLDPANADLSELEPLLEQTRAQGFELVPMRDVAGRRDEIAAFHEAAGAWPPTAPPENRVAPDELWRHVFEHPDFEWDGSFAVLGPDRRIVSLASLTVDHDRRRAEHEWTATLPQARGRHLALLGKLATIRWARDNGIRELVTGNVSDNVAMRALNERLGYRFSHRRLELNRPVG